MSTRCLIGKINRNGLGRYIYCHHDGYPDNILPILEENYDTEEKVDELLNIGNISSLESTLEATKGEAYNERAEDFAYTLPRVGQEFNYLFRDSKWKVEKVKDPYRF